jgi:hypothetical protein
MINDTRKNGIRIKEQTKKQKKEAGKDNPKTKTILSPVKQTAKMEDVDSSELTMIDSKLEQRAIILTFFFLSPMYMLFTGLMFLIVYQQKKILEADIKKMDISKLNEKYGDLAAYRKSIDLGLWTMIFSIICYLSVTFLSMNFVIPWDFSSLNYEYSSIAEGMVIYSWIGGKICFYAAFAFHTMTILDKSHPRYSRHKILLNRWIYVATIIYFIFANIYLFADILEHHMKVCTVYTHTHTSTHIRKNLILHILISQTHSYTYTCT